MSFIVWLAQSTVWLAPSITPASAAVLGAIVSGALIGGVAVLHFFVPWVREFFKSAVPTNSQQSETLGSRFDQIEERIGELRDDLGRESDTNGRLEMRLGRHEAKFDKFLDRYTENAESARENAERSAEERRRILDGLDESQNFRAQISQDFMKLHSEISSSEDRIRKDAKVREDRIYSTITTTVEQAVKDHVIECPAKKNGKK